MAQISFASDNYAGIHPEILNAITKVNIGHEPAYGGDRYTEQAIAKFKEYFGEDVAVHFVFNGTAANVLSLAALLKSYEAVICAEKAHINVDECGAPEKFTGAKLLLVPGKHGKISAENIANYLLRIGDQHAVQPRVISISQSTEYGTVYTLEEIKKLADFAHQNNMYLHMDGARISNAAVSLQTTFKQMTKDVGVDVLSFGGTKNGMMLGEAVIFFNAELAEQFPFIRKQSMQLSSKMRFLSAQFHALLSNDLWQRNAAHANAMAAKLAERLRYIAAFQITHPVEANAIFAIFPKHIIPRLQEEYFFYVWDEALSEVRIMTAFDTRLEDVENFAKLIEQIAKEN